MPGGKRVRPSQHGGDRRFGRSLAEILNAGKVDPNEELDKWDPEDIQEEERQRRAHKNENMGYPEDYEGERGY